MAVEENNMQEEEEQLSDIEIAELARKKLNEKDDEIAKLKKDLAREKLLSNGSEDNDEPVRMSKEECLKIINDPSVCNYDYAVAVCDLVDNEKDEGQPNPLGQDGDAVYSFFKDVIDSCDGDKGKFTAIYQAKLPQDDPKIAMAYNKRKRR